LLPLLPLLSSCTLLLLPTPLPALLLLAPPVHGTLFVDGFVITVVVAVVVVVVVVVAAAAVAAAAAASPAVVGVG